MKTDEPKICELKWLHSGQARLGPSPYKRSEGSLPHENAENSDGKVVAEQSVHCEPPPACYRSLLGPFEPEVSPRVSPQTGGVGVSDGVSRAPECPIKCPESVPECQKGVPDTPGTLSGRFLDTPEPGA